MGKMLIVDRPDTVQLYFGDSASGPWRVYPATTRNLQRIVNWIFYGDIHAYLQASVNGRVYIYPAAENQVAVELICAHVRRDTPYPRKRLGLARVRLVKTGEKP